jgi:uncharacterized DUF497 family protein
MKITFDPLKRAATLQHRSLDFADASAVFAGSTLDFMDDRQDYGETRIQTIGYLGARMVMVVWTLRGDARRILSMRYCNDRERKVYGSQLRLSE